MLYVVHRSSHRDVPGGPGLLPGPPPPQALIVLSHNVYHVTMQTVAHADAWFWSSGEKGEGKKKKTEQRRKRESSFIPVFKTYEEKTITSELLQTSLCLRCVAVKY